jgi:hypothetical protein
MMVLMWLNTVIMKCMPLVSVSRRIPSIISPPLCAMTHLAAQLESSLSLQKAHEEEVSSWRTKHAALKKELDEVGTVIFSIIRYCFYTLTDEGHAASVAVDDVISSSSCCGNGSGSSRVTGGT